MHRLGAHVRGQQAGGILHPDERAWKNTTPDTCPSRSSGHPHKGVQSAEIPTRARSELPGPGRAARGTAKPCPAASPRLTAASAQACSHQSQVKHPRSLPGEGPGVSLHQRLGGLGCTSRLAPAPAPREDLQSTAPSECAGVPAAPGKSAHPNLSNLPFRNYWMLRAARFGENLDPENQKDSE